MSHGTAVVLMENSGAGNGDDKSFPGGKATLVVEATFGGGSVKLQIKCPNGTYADISGQTLSAAGMTSAVDLPMGVYRAVATTATAVYAKLCRIPY